MLSQPVTHHLFTVNDIFGNRRIVSAVLRKKIELAAGVPPTVLRISAYWDEVCARIRAWAEKTLDVDCQATITDRRVFGGKGAALVTECPFAFYFAAEAAPGLCALTMDEGFAIRNAASRLGQEPEGMVGGPPLFMKLLAEQAALSLWQNIASDLGGHNVHSGNALQSDPAAAMGGFEPASRYLGIDIRLEIDGQECHIVLVFVLDFLMRFAGQFLREQENRKAEAHSHTPRSLSESVRASSIALEAVLGRIEMAIGDCAQLEVGQVLTLTGVDPGQLTLSAATINGAADIGTGEIGVWKKQRAMKLHTPISDNFVHEILEL